MCVNERQPTISSNDPGRLPRDDRYAVVLRDSTDRQPAEEVPRASEARQHLLVQLLQGQRRTSDPDAMMEASAEAVGRQLAADRVGFFEMVDDDTLGFTVCWTGGNLDPLVGKMPAIWIGTRYLAEVRAGRTLGVADYTGEPLTADARFDEIGTRALIGAPIIRNGRWHAGLYVNHASVRVWTDDEIALVREVADQTWDAVERARAERALRESEARFRTVWEATSDAIALSGPDGIVLAANPAYLALYGYDEAEVIGRSFSVIFPADRRATAEEQHRAVFAASELPAAYEAQVRRKDGTERTVEARVDFVTEGGRRTAMVSSVRDVTDRHAAEAALRESEERLRLALDAAGMGVYLWDPGADRTDADARLLEMVGLAPDEEFSLTTALNRNIHPDDRVRYAGAAEAMLDPAGPGRLAEEVRWIGSDGDERWLAFTGQAFFEDDGVKRRAIRAIGGVLDVTLRKRIEAERGAFVDAAAHDLRSPLTFLKGQAQLLLRRVRRGQADTAGLESGLAAIDVAAARMVTLIDEMMDAAHLRAERALNLNVVRTDLLALVEVMAEETRQSTTRHDVRVVADIPKLVGDWDEARLSRVLANLFSNAVRYSPEGGEIVARVVREDDTSGTWALVVVSDQGMGIPEADLPYLFERFRRGGNVEGRISGTGIGLAGAKQIIEQHGGHITVESREEEGSTFTVRLPIATKG